MNEKLYRIFKIITPILAIVEFILVIIHLATGLSTCEYKDLMNNIRDHIKPEDEIDKYYDVFCYYSDGVGRLIGYMFVIIFNIVSLIISFIGIIFAFIILSKNKHCVILTLLIFYTISAVVSFIDFMIAAFRKVSLSGYNYIPTGLVSTIESTLDRVKEKKIKLVFITFFYLAVSVGGSVITGKILKVCNNEENNQPNAYQGVQYQYNPQQNFVNNNNYNISNNITPAPVVQENMYQQTNS